MTGRVVFNKRNCVIDCVIREVSETGARLVFGHHIDVPRQFELENLKSGTTHQAELVWQTGAVCGIRFTDWG
jgi:hypothetical protein